MPKDKPLYLTLYQDPAYYETARAIGYSGQSIPDMRKKIEGLSRTHGKEKMVKVIEEIADINGPKGPKEEGTVTLKAETRLLCHQLLGPSPEYLALYGPKDEPPEEPTTDHAGKVKKSRKPRIRG